LIKRLYKDIKKEKPWVKFGLSPFGIWRPGNPESISGFDQYGQLYADAKLWLNKGWVDYFSPQLYWPINRMSQSFPVLLGWWSGENKMHRHLWPGISLGRDTSARNVNETLSQLMISRGMLPKSKGIIHWSISSLTQNPNMINAIVKGPYAKQALVPASPWLDKKRPSVPLVDTIVSPGKLKLQWTYPDYAEVFHWVVYYQYENSETWRYEILNRKDRSLDVNLILQGPSGSFSLRRVGVSAVNRNGNESPIKLIEVKK
jgi:glycosyl hydrolase family 10